MSLWTGLVSALRSWWEGPSITVRVKFKETFYRNPNDKTRKPMELPPEFKLLRPVGKDIPVSARYGAKGPWWNWSKDESGKWVKGKLICARCGLRIPKDKLPVELDNECKCQHPLATGMHKGVDLAAPVGTMVFAITDGHIEAADWEKAGSPKYGFGIRIRQTFKIDKQIWKVWYGHLSEVLVKPAEIVEAGKLIGLSGDTGHVTGAHLHVEIRNPDGQQVPIHFEEEA